MMLEHEVSKEKSDHGEIAIQVRFEVQNQVQRITNLIILCYIPVAPLTLRSNALFNMLNLVEHMKPFIIQVLIINGQKVFLPNLPKSHFSTNQALILVNLKLLLIILHQMPHKHLSKGCPRSHAKCVSSYLSYVSHLAIFSWN